MNLPKEIADKKFTVSMGVLVWVAIISFSMGGLYVRQLDTNETVVTNKEYTKEQVKEVKQFVEQEVGGLRSDWERENKEVHRRLEKIEKKLFK